MAAVDDTISAIDAALAPPPGTDAAPAAAPASPVQNTISAIDAALAAPQGSADDGGDSAPPLTVTPRPRVPSDVGLSKVTPPGQALPTLGDVPGDVALGFGAGVNHAVAAAPGLPGDVSRFADFAPSWLIAKGAEMLGLLPKGKTAHDLYQDAQALDLKPDAFAPPTSGDTTKVYEAVTGKIPEPRTVPGQYAETIGSFIPSAGRNVLTAGVLPAVASETAGQVTKDTGLEPIARIAGGVTGAGLGAAGVAAGEAAKVGRDALKEYRLPVTPQGQQQLAARQVTAAMTDPDAVDRALTPGPMQPGVDPNYELAPGSEPTSFQVTGDLGLGQLERQQRNDAAKAPTFIGRDSRQNAARVDVMQGVQPTGSPADVAASFRQMRQALDQQTQGQVDALVPAAQDANAALGGHGTAEATGYALRQPMADARAAAKETENRLWGLVNQDGGVPAAGIKQAAVDMQKSMTPSAAPMTGEEARIFGVAAGYPQVQRFGDLKDLRSSITDAIADARASGNTQTPRRLGSLLSSVDDALDHGIENQAALDQIAVRRGQMAPESAIGARLAQEANEYIANAKAGRGTLARAGNDGAGVATGFSPAPGAQVQGGGRSFDASGDQGLQGSQPASPFTPEDIDAYRAATAATKARATTFDSGTPGQILKPAARGGFDMPDASVPATVIKDGNANGAQAVRQFLAAGGTPDALADATAYTLRKTATLGDGTIDPVKVQAWVRRNADALAAMPPEVAAKFQTAAGAQQAVNDMMDARRAALDSFDKTAAARIAGLQDGEDVVKHVGSILGRGDAVKQMRDLSTAAANNPSAKDGLRRAIVEHMTGKLLSNTESGTSGVKQIAQNAFQTYLRQNGAALRQVLSTQEMDALNAVGADLERSNRAIAATKGNKSGPGTAQDLLAAPRDANILTKLILEAAPAVAGKAAGGWTGAAAGWLGSKVIARGRTAGLENVDKLVTEAVLNPSLMRALRAKMPLAPDAGTAESLGSRFAGIAARTAAGMYASQPR